MTSIPKNTHCLPETIIMTAVKLKTIANRFVFHPINMTNSRFRILRMLFERKRLTPSEILEFSGGTKSNVSQRLNFLERQGFIKRIYSGKSDRRKVFVKLTLKGEKLVAKLFKRFEHSIKELENCFTKKELSNHFNFIAKLNNILDDSTDRLPELFLHPKQ